MRRRPPRENPPCGCPPRNSLLLILVLLLLLAFLPALRAGRVGVRVRERVRGETFLALSGLNSRRPLPADFPEALRVLLAAKGRLAPIQPRPTIPVFTCLFASTCTTWLGGSDHWQ